MGKIFWGWVLCETHILYQSPQQPALGIIILLEFSFLILSLQMPDKNGFQNNGYLRWEMVIANLARPPPRITPVLLGHVLTTCWSLFKPLKGNDVPATSLGRIFHGKIWLTVRALAFEIPFLLVTHFRYAVPLCTKSNEASPGGGCSARTDI